MCLPSPAYRPVPPCPTWGFPETTTAPQDMADSRRINANIREEDEKRPAEEQPPFGVYAVILSSEFWPPFKDEKLEVPEDIREALDVYCKKYEKLKVLPTSLWWGLRPDLETLPNKHASWGWARRCPRLGEVCLCRSLLPPPQSMHWVKGLWPALCSPPLPPSQPECVCPCVTAPSSQPHSSWLPLPLSILWPLRTRAHGWHSPRRARRVCSVVMRPESADCSGGV